MLLVPVQWTSRTCRPHARIADEVLSEGPDEENVFDYSAWMAFQRGTITCVWCQTLISSAGQRASVAWLPMCYCTREF